MLTSFKVYVEMWQIIIQSELRGGLIAAFTALFKIFFHPEFNESDSVLDQLTPSLTPLSHCFPLPNCCTVKHQQMSASGCWRPAWSRSDVSGCGSLCSSLFLFFFYDTFPPPLFRYPWSADLHGPGVQAGSWCVAAEGGPQREQSLQRPLQHHAHRGAQPVPWHSTKGRVAHEPSRCTGFHPPGTAKLRIYNHGNW